jgi:hypothetical protein
MYESNPPVHTSKDLEEVNSCTAQELICVAEWMKRIASLQAKQLEEDTKKQTSDAHINLIAGCPESMPFWTDINKKLECFACNFSQKNAKNYEHFANIQLMTKRIQKNGESLTIAFCPSCTSDEPWIIHNNKNYTMVHLAKESNDEPAVTAVTKPKILKNWLARPQEVTLYRHAWTSSKHYDKPANWREQEECYDNQVKKYKCEKATYDAFCNETLARLPAVEHQTTRKAIQEIEKKKLDALHQERFAQHIFSRRYKLPHQPPLVKQQKRTSSSLNSPTPTFNKENANSVPSP